MRLCVSLLTSLFLVSSAFAFFPEVEVSTSFGPLRGYTTRSSDGRAIKVFKGIPYAAPPLGKLRWKMPQHPASWDEPLDAIIYKKSCRSTPRRFYLSQLLGFSEDCLYTNVFADARCTPGTSCPVLFYVHGGNLTVDAANMFNDTYIIENFVSHGIVMVIPEYRQAYAGTAVFDDRALVPRNLALHDLHFALQWTNREIRNFGGNVKKITMMGHSSGGGFVMFLAFSPHFTNKRQKLFDKVISMSPGIGFHNLDGQKNLTRIFVDTANCTRDTTQEILDCMEQIGDDELFDVYEEYRKRTGELLNGIVLDEPIFPSGKIQELWKNPMKFSMMAGSTAREIDLVPSNRKEDGELLGLQNTKELDQIYEYLRNTSKIVTSHSTGTQAVYINVYAFSSAAAQTGADVYLYSYDQLEHSRHTDDLSFLLGIHGFERDDNERVVAQFYPKLFRNYTLYDVPSPNWTPLNLHGDNYYSIKYYPEDNRFCEMKKPYEKATLDYWYRLAPKIDSYITKQKARNKTFDLRDLVVLDEEVVQPERTGDPFPWLAVLTLGLFTIFVTGSVCHCCWAKRAERVQYQHISAVETGVDLVGTERTQLLSQTAKSG